jgi:hypothetical protein
MRETRHLSRWTMPTSKRRATPKRAKSLVEKTSPYSTDSITLCALILFPLPAPLITFVPRQISLPYPNASPSATDAPPPFLLRFDGSHVLQGLRAAVEMGFADDGLPSWIGEVAKEGRNALQIGG